MFNQLYKLANDVNAASQRATYRALNKSLSKTNTQFIREASSNLAVASKEIRGRFFQRKANSSSLSAYISYGIQHGLSYAALKPKVKLVGKGKGKRPQVSVKLPEGRITPNNAWAFQAGSKTIVLERKGRARKPIRTKRLDVLPYAPQTAPLNEFFFSDFEKQFQSQLEYETRNI